MLKRYWVFLVVFGLLLSACSIAVEANPGEAGMPTESVQPEPESVGPQTPDDDYDDIKPPLAALTINGAVQTSGLGTYCWSDDSKGMGICVDAIGIATPQEALLVKSPFTAQFAIPFEELLSEVVVTVRPVNPESEMDEAGKDGWRWWMYAEGEHYELPVDGERSLDLELAPGIYVLDLFARWEQLGDASYGFLVQVE
jgi:hypothetical protein